MAEILMFHHAQGLTDGVLGFAATLRAAGHTVHTPDLYDGNTYATLDEGLGYAREVGFDKLMELGVATADEFPAELVYAGFSLGVMPAQRLAQTRAGARGALLYEAFLPPSEFGAGWPDGVPVQVHGMDSDPFFAADGDLDVAREMVDKTEHAELFVYPGNSHLFSDSSLATYDAKAAELLTERTLAFLTGL